jgi:hypothetical protein
MIGITVSYCRVLSRLGGGGMGVVYEAEAASRWKIRNCSLRETVAGS